MKKANVILIMCFALGLTGTAGWAEDNADEIMRKHYALPKAQDMQSFTIMALRKKDGSRTDRKLKMYSKQTKQGTNSFAEFLSPADVKGTKFLTIGNKQGDDDQRLWLPDLGKVRKIASAGKSGKFMGSDFTYYDMENHSFSDYTYTLLGEEECKYTKDGVKAKRTCWKMASVPVDKDAPYSQVLLWISQEDYFVYKTEMYNKKKAVEKRIYITEVKTVASIIVPVKTVAVNVNGHKTLLKMEDIKVNSGLSDSIFTVKNLEK
ncbi:outer membrane lipoprotein-sorting protein [bacterium]|nr:outer membrane lipoprotein-sorting protein [bacterium]